MKGTVFLYAKFKNSRLAEDIKREMTAIIRELKRPKNRSDDINCES